MNKDARLARLVEDFRESLIDSCNEIVDAFLELADACAATKDECDPAKMKALMKAGARFSYATNKLSGEIQVIRESTASRLGLDRIGEALGLGSGSDVLKFQEDIVYKKLSPNVAKFFFQDKLKEEPEAVHEEEEEEDEEVAKELEEMEKEIESTVIVVKKGDIESAMKVLAKFADKDDDDITEEDWEALSKDLKKALGAENFKKINKLFGLDGDDDDSTEDKKQ